MVVPSDRASLSDIKHDGRQINPWATSVPGSIASSLTSLRHVRSGGNFGNARLSGLGTARACLCPSLANRLACDDLGSVRPASPFRGGRTEAPRLRQNNPTGKIPLKASGKSAIQVCPSFPCKRGVSRSSRNAGEDAVDAAASARKRSQGETLVSDQSAR